MTAAESGTYTDFANINLGGLLRRRLATARTRSRTCCSTSSTRCTCCSPARNLQLSRKTPDAVLKHALRVIRKGYGFPSLFNADAVVEEQLRQGKTLEDARAGGCSGCVEVGAFGKEAYILTGYFNLVKVLELALHDGFDPRTGKQLGAAHRRRRRRSRRFDDLFAAFDAQLRHFLDIKIRGNQLIERMYATRMPAPFLSVLTDDCIAQGHGLQRRRRPLQQHLHPVRRHRQPHRQPVGAQGSWSSTRATLPLADLVAALDADFAGQEPLRQRLRQPDAQVRQRRRLRRRADGARRSTHALRGDRRPAQHARAARYRVEMLPTTCHVYFGSVTGAMPDGRKAGPAALRGHLARCRAPTATGRRP